MNMASQPLATVVVTTFRHERYIARCLDSILQQQAPFPWDILVIDDASDDRTPQIIRDYAAANPDIIRPILLEKNIGFCTERYRDIFFPLSRGKYIATIDGDDYWTNPRKLSSQVLFLQRNPSYTACGHLVSILNEAGVPSAHLPRLPRSRRLSEVELILEHTVQFSTFCFRKDAACCPEFFNHIPAVAPNMDILFYAVLSSKGKVKAFAKKWSVYRIHNSGIFSKTLAQKKPAPPYEGESRLINAFYPGASPMKRALDLYTRLHKWTTLRRSKGLLPSIPLFFRTAISHPAALLRLYFRRYIF